MKKNKKMIVGFLAPAVIIFLIVFLYPIIRTIMMSMYKIESVTDTMEWWTFVGLGNYQKLFTTAIFKTAMMNILKIWALGGIIVLSEYCQCGSACNDVAAVCIQFQVRTFEVGFGFPGIT